MIFIAGLELHENTDYCRAIHHGHHHVRQHDGYFARVLRVFSHAIGTVGRTHHPVSKCLESGQ
jgi:hypothetical protein